jgi:hypothetical protein
MTDALCLFVPEPRIDGGSESCFDTASVQDGHATASLGATVYGLVPDAVASVVVTFANGQTGAASVTNNLFVVAAPLGRPTAGVQFDPSISSQQRALLLGGAAAAGPPPSPIKAVMWYDGGGRILTVGGASSN